MSSPHPVSEIALPFRKVNSMTQPWLFPSRLIVCSSALSLATTLNRLEVASAAQLPCHSDILANS